MRISISSIFTKEHPWLNRSRQSLHKSDVSDLLVIWVNRSKKTSAFYDKRVNRSHCSSLFLKEDQRDWIARVDLKKRATLSESIPSIFKKGNRSDSLFSQLNQSFALSIPKNERFARKTDDRIPNPEFLLFVISFCLWGTVYFKLFVCSFCRDRWHLAVCEIVVFIGDRLWAVCFPLGPLPKDLVLDLAAIGLRPLTPFCLVYILLKFNNKLQHVLN